MLLAVEGGRFFSSSASGFSKGLVLLLLGNSKEKKLMRVASLNHYQLEELESDLDHQLATRKSRASRGCAHFICFHRCASAGVDEPPLPKVGPVNHSETLPTCSSSASDTTKACDTKSNVDESERKFRLKSNLKKTSTNCAPVIGESDQVEERQNGIVNCTERRKIRWTDSCGRDLAEIREFEPSDDDASDDDFELDGYKHGCDCVIQ